MIPLKRFDISPPDWGTLRRSRCVLFFSLNMILPCLLMYYIVFVLFFVSCPCMAINAMIVYSITMGIATPPP